MYRHKGTRNVPAPYYMLPKHCNGECGLAHNVPFPFSMLEGKRWGRHVVKSTVARPPTRDY